MSDQTTPRWLVFALTFVVAFCSITYELIYSEMLTVVFGGRAMRYAITIGLFLFFLGVGAFAFSDLGDARENFLRVEAYLAVAGPVGLLFIVFVNAVPNTSFQFPRPVALALSHLPVVVVGLLSGLEVPLLTNLLEDADADSTPLVARAYRGGRRVVRRVLSLGFVLSPADDDDPPDAFSAVLGMDYLGSLAGTVVYALYLYPELGLIPAVFVLGLLNALAAVAYALVGRERETVSVSLPRSTPVLFAVVLVLSGTYAGVVVNGDRVESAVTETYLEARIENEFVSDEMQVSVTDHFNTDYQSVTWYERTWTGADTAWTDPGQTDRCLRLDSQIQLCDNWVEPYHEGLVDAPAGLYDDVADKDVLLVGGGDYIAVEHLADRGADVTQVDIDGEFMAYARNSSRLAAYHEGAYDYENLTTVVDDAFTYLQSADETFDLVLLDVPGIRSDELLSLYSTEFYRLLRHRLAPDGLVVTWGYDRASFAEHYAVYTQTLRAAGYDYFAPYHATGDLDGNGDSERVERFYVLAPDAAARRSLAPLDDRYPNQSVAWRELPAYRGVEPNSIFHPNYDIIVDY